MSAQRKLHPVMRNDSDAAATYCPALSSAPPTPDEHSAVVVVAVPSSTAASQAPSMSRSPAPAQRSVVHVAPDIRALMAAVPTGTPHAAPATPERRDLNTVVHGVLIIGLLISITLILVGFGLDLLYQRELPTSAPNIGDTINRALALRPSGFLALGLLVLIATPILRVIGAIGAFVYARDWRFAALTALVLLILLISLVLGRS
jgi:uncharacterized membrane protein